MGGQTGTGFLLTTMRGAVREGVPVHHFVTVLCHEFDKVEFGLKMVKYRQNGYKIVYLLLATEI